MKHPRRTDFAALLVLVLLIVVLLAFGTVIQSPSSQLPVSPTATHAPTRTILANASEWHEVWRRTVGQSYSSVPLITTSGNVVALSIWNENATSLVARDIQNGRTLWATALPSRVVHSLASDSDRIYVALSSGVQALRLTDGAPLWNTNRLPEHTSYYLQPVIQDAVLQVYGVYGKTTLYSIERENGQITSSEEYSDELILKTAATFIIERGIDLLSIDCGTNRSEWQITTRASVGTHRWPAFIDSAIMVFATGPHLVSLRAVDPTTGQAVWSTAEEIASNFVIVNSEIYALKADARLVAYDVRTGHEVEKLQLSGGSLDVAHASEYGLSAVSDTLLVYLGDSQELIVFGRD
jgi:outer membrane protein assembly factor BamB